MRAFARTAERASWVDAAALLRRLRRTESVNLDLAVSRHPRFLASIPAEPPGPPQVAAVSLAEELAKALQPLHLRFDSVDKHLLNVDKQLLNVDKRLLNVDKRLLNVDTRLLSVDKQLLQLHRQTGATAESLGGLVEVVAGLP